MVLRAFAPSPSSPILSLRIGGLDRTSSRVKGEKEARSQLLSNG